MCNFWVQFRFLPISLRLRCGQTHVSEPALFFSPVPLTVLRIWPQPSSRPRPSPTGFWWKRPSTTTTRWWRCPRQVDWDGGVGWGVWHYNGTLRRILIRNLKEKVQIPLIVLLQNVRHPLRRQKNAGNSMYKTSHGRHRKTLVGAGEQLLPLFGITS